MLADRRPRTPRPDASEVLRPPSGGELLLIPAGEFTMGQEGGRADEAPHAVSVASFYMDRYLVTQELYEKIMGVNPSKQKGKQNPVERIQWTDAARFCNKCSELDGLTPCYDLQTWDCRFEADGYRLPTEAEWEYACRAGSRSRYFFGDDAAKARQYAWFKPHSEGMTHPVGRKLPNAWGLHDMLGNVWEWCNDWYGEGYYQESPGRRSARAGDREAAGAARRRVGLRGGEVHRGLPLEGVSRLRRRLLRLGHLRFPAGAKSRGSVRGSPTPSAGEAAGRSEGNLPAARLRRAAAGQGEPRSP